jgi:hypothetical protein
MDLDDFVKKNTTKSSLHHYSALPATYKTPPGTCNTINSLSVIGHVLLFVLQATTVRFNDRGKNEIFCLPRVSGHGKMSKLIWLTKKNNGLAYFAM